jgi:hypothetical protein
MRFTALQDFYSDATQSQYVAGLSYETRPNDRRLFELIPQWIMDGLVELGGPAAKVMGRE